MIRNKNNKILVLVSVAVVVILVIAVAATLLLGNNANTNGQNSAKNTNQEAQKQAVQQIINTTKNISLTSSGFNPQTVTINAGQRVVWQNISGTQGTVNSDNFPNNSLWPFLNLGLFANGSSVGVTFDKPGTYTYHNQLNPSEKGTVIVK